VSEGGVVKDEEIGERGADEIKDQAEEPGKILESSQGKERSPGRHVAYQVIRYSVRNCLQILSRGHWLMYAYWEGARWKN